MKEKQNEVIFKVTLLLAFLHSIFVFLSVWHREGGVMEERGKSEGKMLVVTFPSITLNFVSSLPSFSVFSLRFLSSLPAGGTPVRSESTEMERSI